MFRSFRPHKPPPAPLRIPSAPMGLPSKPPPKKQRRLRNKSQPPWYSLLSEAIYLYLRYIFASELNTFVLFQGLTPVPLIVATGVKCIPQILEFNISYFPAIILFNHIKDKGHYTIITLIKPCR